MTNRIAIAIAVLIVLLLAADRFWLHLDLPVLAGRALDRSVEYLSFWR
ncbi:hypothetical protein JHW45_07840 [Paracoccus stylophorae]|uniref:Glyceraldehyde-3-phosphate dehydrogenase n=1 Tax=Paracoccus stylophorae TaxID=659350 RepID=A0ABY7T0X1_9RHOB|nr:hypothetical protein [Paracoccus stylophorae]WCR12222.1 hypothetical protein JHW45_07840 [Paracoccus stylophorae]